MKQVVSKNGFSILLCVIGLNYFTLSDTQGCQKNLKKLYFTDGNYCKGICNHVTLFLTELNFTMFGVHTYNITGNIHDCTKKFGHISD